MTIWTKTIDPDCRDFNAAAMSRVGFAPDPGRTLSAEEVAGLELTQPEDIRKPVRPKEPVIYWNCQGVQR